MYSIAVFGLYAANGQSLPPQSEGQNSARLPVPGMRSSLYVGRPVVGSMLLKTVCLTYGVADTNEILSALRSRRYRYPLRAGLMSPFTVFPSFVKSAMMGASGSSQSHDSFHWYWKCVTSLPVSGLIATVDDV